jgi:hypothetical protein
MTSPKKSEKKSFLVEVKNAFSGMVKSGGCEKKTLFKNFSDDFCTLAVFEPLHLGIGAS